MQPLPGQAEPRGEHRVCPVQPVTHAGVPDRCHVHPDLVGAAGLQDDLDEAGRPERLQRVVMRHRRPAPGDDGEPAVTGRVPADRGIDGPAERIGVALHESVVALVHLAVPECALQRAIGRLALGQHHQPRGVRVQPVHDALALGGTAGSQRVAGREDSLQHRRPGPAGGRMRGDARGLVDDQDVGILIHHGQAGDRRRPRHDGRRRRQRHVQPVARGDTVRFRCRGAADEDRAAAMSSAALALDRPNIRQLRQGCRQPVGTGWRCQSSAASGTGTWRCPGCVMRCRQARRRQARRRQASRRQASRRQARRRQASRRQVPRRPAGRHQVPWQGAQARSRRS